MANDQPPQIDPVVIDSVRAALSQADQDLANADRDLEAKVQAVKFAEVARDVIADKRARLSSFLVRTVGDEAVLPSSAALATTAPAIQLLPRKAAELAATMLSSGRSLKSEAIYTELQSMGYFIDNENPARRLGQMLSSSGMFDSDRVAGWSLKKPAA